MGDKEKCSEKYSQFIERTIPIIVKMIIGPINMILKTKVNCSRFLRPRYSARYLFPELPKKFVTKIVIIRQKLREILIVPNISLPKVLATKKLNANGIMPTKASARPV